jgi:serine/threonine protein kinase
MSRDRHPDLTPDYVYVEDIAIAGFANVYRYRDVKLDRDVAVKVLKGRKERDFDDILNEARAMAKLEHEHIVRIYVATVSNDRQPCIIMEYCPGPSGPGVVAEGRDLQTLLRQGQLDLRKVVHLGIAIGGAVQAAHDAGIIHCDIKPSNILIDRRNRPLLTDFGIARMQTARRNAPSGMSIPWSPPEVLEGADGDVASDVYSFGATLYHLIEGRSPFAAEPGTRDTEQRLIDRICTAALPPIQRPIPTELRDLVMGMLNRDPSHRTSSIRVAVERLARIEQDLGAPDDSEPWHVPGTVLVRTKPANERLDGTVVRRSDWGQSIESTVLRAPGQATPVDATVLRTPDQADRIAKSGPVGTRKRSGRWIWALALGVVVVGVVGVVVATYNGPDAPGGTVSATEAAPTDGTGGIDGDELPPGPPRVTGERVDDHTVTFTWVYSSQMSTDTFAWQTTDGAQHGTATEPTATVSAPVGTRTCLQIKVVRANGRNGSVEWSDPGCVS